MQKINNNEYVTLDGEYTITVYGNVQVYHNTADGSRPVDMSREDTPEEVENKFAELMELAARS